ncbi:NAD(P)/FAD-dependent oxidoreductase [Plastorhodobacter daqingensis]|uniref:NAD(P)/FAD-dependent oxidoreductase n=1 Tax=Plastorhodobacter daqingensis TaxID=1387281 RepID=A0ABW2UKE7_9RHOB
MLNDPRSHGLWEKSAPEAPATAPLSGEITADVAVIGAGYTGLSAALHLAEGGASAVVLEAAEIGFGGAGRNVGLVNAGMWVMPDTLPGVLGAVHGDRLLGALGDGPGEVFDLISRHDIDCEAVRTGTLHCAVGAAGMAELRDRAVQWQSRGAPVHLLDAREAEARIGSRAYAGALLDLRAGTVQPLAYARGLARAALKAGAVIHTRTPVGALQQADAGWQLVTPEGRVHARQVLMATDAYTTRVFPELATEQVRLPYFNIATVPLSDNLARSVLPERQGAWDTREVLSSFRFDRENRLVFGSVGALRGPGAALHRNWARRAIRSIFPQLEGVAFESEWYGQIGMTADNLPRFHRLAPGIISFSGYNGRGIAPGTVFGRLASELLLGRISEDDLPLPRTDPAPARFRTAREAYYEIGAQLVHLTANRV